jgi:hypothetical protein
MTAYRKVHLQMLVDAIHRRLEDIEESYTLDEALDLLDLCERLRAFPPADLHDLDVSTTLECARQITEEIAPDVSEMLVDSDVLDSVVTRAEFLARGTPLDDESVAQWADDLLSLGSACSWASQQVCEDIASMIERTGYALAAFPEAFEGIEEAARVRRHYEHPAEQAPQVLTLIEAFESCGRAREAAFEAVPTPVPADAPSLDTMLRGVKLRSGLDDLAWRRMLNDADAAIAGYRKRWEEQEVSTESDWVVWKRQAYRAASAVLDSVGSVEVFLQGCGVRPERMAADSGPGHPTVPEAAWSRLELGPPFDDVLEICLCERSLNEVEGDEVPPGDECPSELLLRVRAAPDSTLDLRDPDVLMIRPGQEYDREGACYLVLDEARDLVLVSLQADVPLEILLGQPEQFVLRLKSCRKEARP